MFKIAITGKANSGKNTISTLFSKHVSDSQNFVCKSKYMALADPIKEIVLNIFPQADKNCLYGPSALRAEFISNAFKNDKPLSYRQALMDIGSLGRSYNPMIWVNNFDNRYKNITSDTDLLVVTDVRYRNEFEYFKENGFSLIRINRSGSSKIQDSSETEQETIKDSEFDFIINNDKSLSELDETVRIISEKLF